MNIHHLQALFQPASVAVIGASNRPNRIGTLVMNNLLRAGFPGPVMPVNPKHQSVCGVLAYPDVPSLPITPDMAVEKAQDPENMRNKLLDMGMQLSDV